MGVDPEHEFREWVMARRSHLRRTAYLLCGDWRLSDDLVQEALTHAFAAWSRITKCGEPDAYVRKILLRLHLDHRRRPSRRGASCADLPDSPSRSAGGEALGERDRVLLALRDVAPGQRAVLVLRFWEDLSVEQTAQALGDPPGIPDPEEELTVTVTDPAGHWRGETITQPHCSPGLGPSWIVDLSGAGSTPKEAVDEALDAFRDVDDDLPLGQASAYLALEAPPVGYVGSGTQTWVMLKDNKSYSTILVADTGSGSGARPDALCGR